MSARYSEYEVDASTLCPECKEGTGIVCVEDHFLKSKNYFSTCCYAWVDIAYTDFVES